MSGNTTDREGFEKWIKRVMPLEMSDPLAKNTDGGYLWCSIQTYEMCWNDAQAQSAERVRVLEEIITNLLDAEVYYSGRTAALSVSNHPAVVAAKSALGEK